MGSTAEMPFLDHLEELRWRIIWSLAAIVVGVVLGFVIVLKFNLLTWMQGPIAAVPAWAPAHEHASGRRILDHDADGDHRRRRDRAAGGHLPGVALPRAGAASAREEDRRCR